MNVIDEVCIRSAGRTAEIRLCHGDMVQAARDHPVDILVVPAFPNDYIPMAGTVIKRLHEDGIVLASLARSKEVDLREEFSAWLSYDLSPAPQGFRRILCTESSSSRKLFGALLAAAVRSSEPLTVSMPVPGTGGGGLSFETALSTYLTDAMHWLSLGLPVKCLNIFVFKQEAVSAARAIFQSVRNEYRNGLPAPRAEPAYDFFVSYARDNEAAAQEVANRLLSNHLSVFVDQQGVEVGSIWQHQIFMALEQSRQVICLLSPSYLASDYCLEEFNIALLRDRSLGGRVLVPVLLYTTQLPTYMQIRQYLDAREGSDRRIEEICSQLASRAVGLQD